MLRELKWQKKLKAFHRSPSIGLSDGDEKCPRWTYRTLCSCFNAIQTALTAPDRKQVIIFQFLNKACVNGFSSDWTRCYVSRALWKHRRILNAKRMCQRWRWGLLETWCLEREASSSAPFVLKVTAQSVCLHYIQSCFMINRAVPQTGRSAVSVRAWLTAYLIFVMLWTTAQGAFRIPARSQTKRSLIRYFISLNRDAITPCCTQTIAGVDWNPHWILETILNKSKHLITLFTILYY